MTQFDWRTDEERGWDQPTGTPTPSPDQGPRWRQVLQTMRHRWRAVLTGLLLLAALSALAARTATLRVQQAEATARDELNAAYALLVDAAANQDAELFLTLLGGDRSWRQAQLDSFEKNAFLRRDALGLTWQPQEETLTQIELSPDLQQAVITATLSYAGYAGGDAQQTFALQHALRYELYGARWQLVPHDVTSFDGWQTFDQHDGLQTVFPQQDAVLGRRLTQDVRETLQALCETLVDCPAGLHVQLRFELNEESLHTPSLWINGMRRDGFSISLPAPSLVGLPVDEAGYQALRNAYLRKMLDQLTSSLVRRDVVADSALHAAMRRQLLVNLNLMAWPPPDVVTAAAASDSDADILALCTNNLQQGVSLLRYDAARQDWMTELEGRNIVRLVGLEKVPGVLLREQQPPRVDPTSRITWWAEGRERLFFDDYFLGDTVPSSPAFIAGRPDGQNFWIYLGDANNCNGRACNDVVTRGEPTTWSPDGAHTLFRRELEGSRSAPASDDVLWLGDRNGETLQRLEESFHPFWIDNETFGYLVVPPGEEQSFPYNYDLVVQRLDDQGVNQVTSVPLQLMGALEAWDPDDERLQETGIAISYIFAHPSRPQIVYITAVRFTDLVSSFARPQSSIYLFEADVASGDVRVRIPSGQVQWTMLPRLSPDGRFLAYVAYDPQNGQGTVAVHDLIADVRHGNVYERPFHSPSSDSLYGPDAYPSIDWSQGSRDLLILDGGVLRIVNPQTPTEQTIIPPTAACSHAAWAD